MDRSGKPARTTTDDVETRIGWRMAGIGMEVASTVAGGALIGWLVDRWRGGTTWLLVGSIAGLVVGMWTLVRGTLKLNKQLEREAPTKGRGKPLPLPPDKTDDGPFENNEDDNDQWDDSSELEKKIRELKDELNDAADDHDDQHDDLQRGSPQR